MRIQCLLHRSGGSLIEIGGVAYHFAPDAEGVHVCEVSDPAAIEILLNIPEAYRPAETQAAPVQAAPAPLRPRRKGRA